MKTYEGVGVSLNAFLSSAVNGVRRSAPLFLPSTPFPITVRKKSRYFFNTRLVGLRAGLHALEKEKLITGWSSRTLGTIPNTSCWDLIIVIVIIIIITIIIIIIIIVGLDNAVATGYGLNGPGIESQWGARFSAPTQTVPGNHPASYAMGTGVFPEYGGRGMTLTAHPHLSPRLKKLYV